MKQSFTVMDNFSHRLISWTSQKYNRSFAILQRTVLWIFMKRFMKTSEKKHSFHNKHTYIYRPQTFWSFMNFYFVHTYCKDLFCLWKNSHYAYILLYLHKTLPTLENEKEQWQIRFSKKLLGKLIFLRVTKNFKMFYFTHTTAWVLKK